MDKKANTPRAMKSPESLKPEKFTSNQTTSEKNFLHSELSSNTVREKLSSTRHILEQTLSKKGRQLDYTSKPNIQPTDNTHNQLKKPDFGQLNNIFENYMKVPTKQRIQYKNSSAQRSASAPPVYQKTKDLLIKEKEEKFKQECTFKPTINKVPHSKNLDYVERKFNREEWFKNLTKPRNEVLEQREKMKREKEEQDNQNCSFRPMISSFRSTSTSRLSIEERLYSIENKHSQREQIKREKDETEANSYPYSPQIAKSVAVLMDKRKTQAPLYKRIYEIQQEKHALKQMEMEKVEKIENMTFRPYVSPNSRKLAVNKCQGSLIDRLSRDTSQCKDRLSDSSLTFASSESKRYSPKEFLDRQKEHFMKSQKLKQELVEKSGQDLLFRPEINQNSNLIAYYKKNYSQETLDDKIKRIGSEAVAKKKQLAEQLNNEHCEKYTFEPEINIISRQLGKSNNLPGYLEEMRARRKIQAQASVAELQKICSFSPRVNSPRKYSSIVSHYKQGARILEDIEKARKEKQKFMNSLKRETEVEKFSCYTFHPQGLSRVKSEGNVEVKGIDRFHELRNMAKKQQLEKQQREKKFLYKDMARDLVYSPI